MKVSKIFGAMFLSVMATGAFAGASDTDLAPGEQIDASLGLELTLSCNASITAANDLLSSPTAGSRLPLSVERLDTGAVQGSKEGTVLGMPVRIAGTAVVTAVVPCPYKIKMEAISHLEQQGTFSGSDTADEIKFYAAMSNGPFQGSGDPEAAAVDHVNGTLAAGKDHSITFVIGSAEGVALAKSRAARSGVYHSEVPVIIEAL